LRMRQEDVLSFVCCSEDRLVCWWARGRSAHRILRLCSHLVATMFNSSCWSQNRPKEGEYVTSFKALEVRGTSCEMESETSCLEFVAKLWTGHQRTWWYSWILFRAFTPWEGLPSSWSWVIKHYGTWMAFGIFLNWVFIEAMGFAIIHVY